MLKSGWRSDGGCMDRIADALVKEALIKSVRPFVLTNQGDGWRLIAASRRARFNREWRYSIIRPGGTMRIRQCILSIACLSVLAGNVQIAAAQAGDYPSRAIRLIAPYPPGGGVDIA